jgi:hypothetical protein
MSGAVAIIKPDTWTLIGGYPIPSGDGRILVPDLLDLLDQLAPLHVGQVVIEQVHSMPRQGVSTTFTFGRALGSIEAVMQSYRWPVAYISPAVWKRKLNLPKDDKDGARQWAREQWPESDLFGTKVRGQAIGDAAALATAWWRSNR